MNLFSINGQLYKEKIYRGILHGVQNLILIHDIIFYITVQQVKDL